MALVSRFQRSFIEAGHCTFIFDDTALNMLTARPGVLLAMLQASVRCANTRTVVAAVAFCFDQIIAAFKEVIIGPVALVGAAALLKPEIEK